MGFTGRSGAGDDGLNGRRRLPRLLTLYRPCLPSRLVSHLCPAARRITPVRSMCGVGLFHRLVGSRVALFQTPKQQQQSTTSRWLAARVVVVMRRLRSPLRLRTRHLINLFSAISSMTPPHTPSRAVVSLLTSDSSYRQNRHHLHARMKHSSLVQWQNIAGPTCRHPDAWGSTNRRNRPCLSHIVIVCSGDATRLFPRAGGLQRACMRRGEQRDCCFTAVHRTFQVWFGKVWAGLRPD